MSDLNTRPSKRAKLTYTSNSLQGKPADLTVAIPPAPKYDPLLYRDNYREPTIELPIHTSIDPYSLFILFLTEAHFEAITTNTNRYAESKGATESRGAGIVGSRI
jgi:hypothetical protein